ncbi:MAG: twin-arginine translocation signal domain-containing protein [Proteobacteria bacterium]|nr:twin-arginine translocation signal domain-containing protein [Pseudomonadota bacterium]MBU1138175.1 twin-arginine translocation signal domain-containing protein [Pseudomonadota bacterium]MBU1231566.1 twin-arginine translocation signal domain-containing protein [Pseudomonadota bacterium]MBU1419110.1 twin-arginine translocation signal domain-containing protein [Pseudomonadota bacterium]MBU1456491.1 twin-arginine translocation signal domain-containing protein [Pseudomonadota bacterium]
MTDRRDFLKGSLVAASALVVGSVKIAGAEVAPYTNIVYTAANPGKWDKKVGSHLPSISVEGNKVTLFTKHGMAEKHFIVRHTLVLADGTVVGAETFTGTSAEAKSSYELPAGYKGVIYATSFCNLHDFWVNEYTV